MIDAQKLDRIVDAYRRANLEASDGYSPESYNLLREDTVITAYETNLLFRSAFLGIGWDAAAIRDKRILEVGCAWGFRLNQLLGFGFRPENLHGIDLLEPYVAEARATNPRIHFDVMSATRIEQPDNAFHGAFGAMALSAMLDSAVIDAALAEMCRVSRELVLIIDDFDAAHESQNRGAVFFKGVPERHVTALGSRGDVAEVREIGSYWSRERTPWRLYKALQVVAPSIAYAVAIRALAKHSHRGYLIRLKKPA